MNKYPNIDFIDMYWSGPHFFYGSLRYFDYSASYGQNPEYRNLMNSRIEDGTPKLDADFMYNVISCIMEKSFGVILIFSNIAGQDKVVDGHGLLDISRKLGSYSTSLSHFTLLSPIIKDEIVEYIKYAETFYSQREQRLKQIVMPSAAKILFPEGTLDKAFEEFENIEGINFRAGNVNI
jgi:hypothetical protein